MNYRLTELKVLLFLLLLSAVSCQRPMQYVYIVDYQ